MYQASEKRYESMKYSACGNSGLKLPAVSLLWSRTRQCRKELGAYSAREFYGLS